MEEEDVWFEIASKIKYCHGTSSKFVDSIKKYGLLPRKTDGIRPSIYKGGLESKKTDSVYLSKYYDKETDFCDIAAKNAAKNVGGEPVIIDIKLDKEDLVRFERDEDSWSETQYEDLWRDAVEFTRKTGETAACMDSAVKRVIEEAIKEGKLTWEEAKKAPPWFREIACFGRFAIRGGIRPEKLKI